MTGSDPRFDAAVNVAVGNLLRRRIWWAARF